MEWATSPTGARLPLDPGAVVGRDLVPLDVVLHVPSMRGYVCTAGAMADAERWLDRDDCELRTSHWETCKGAVNHRNGGLNEKQERMEL